jgi:hypothetical protein
VTEIKAPAARKITNDMSHVEMDVEMDSYTIAPLGSTFAVFSL